VGRLHRVALDDVGDVLNQDFLPDRVFLLISA
jgi:hypothetical protein